MRDITVFETDSEFPTLVRQPMLQQQAGTADFDLLRPLTQGDSKFNSERLASVHGYYYWQQLNELPFVAVLTYASEDLIDYDYDLRLPSDSIVNFFGWEAMPAPYYPPSPVLSSDGHGLSFVMFQGGPTSYTRQGISYGNLSVRIEVHKYINDLDGAFNPGMYI